MEDITLRIKDLFIKNGLTCIDSDDGLFDMVLIGKQTEYLVKFIKDDYIFRKLTALYKKQINPKARILFVSVSKDIQLTKTDFYTFISSKELLK